MKNNNNQHIAQARSQHTELAASDMLVVERVVHENIRRLQQKPRRKRQVDYVKKIENDSFLFSA